MMDIYQLSGGLDSVDIATLLGAAEAASFERERGEVVRAVAEATPAPAPPPPPSAATDGRPPAGVRN